MLSIAPAYVAMLNKLGDAIYDSDFSNHLVPVGSCGVYCHHSIDGLATGTSAMVPCPVACLPREMAWTTDLPQEMVWTTDLPRWQ